MNKRIPAVEELEVDGAESQTDSLVSLSVEDVLTARVGPVVLRVAGRVEPTGLELRLAVEVIRTSSAPAPVASYQLELTCVRSTNQ